MNDASALPVPPHVPALLLAVSQEVPVLAGVDVCVNGQEEALVELKGTRELLRQLPHTLQELVDDGGHLLRVSIQVGIPGDTAAPQPSTTQTLLQSLMMSLKAKRGDEA